MDPDTLSRFRHDLEAITTRPPDALSPLGIAVSGGGDSLGLLLLAAAAYPGHVTAVTVDHRLRAEAADEAQKVADICASIHVPHDIVRLPDAPPERGNRQQWAREARYAALADWAGYGGRRTRHWVAVAHQQDDVAEGFLMRARRGAGVGGMAMMVAERALSQRRGSARLIRPLLGWRRAELAAIVAEAGLTPVADPGNHDPKYDRSRIRAMIAASDDLPVPRLAMAAHNLRDAEIALEWASEDAWRNRSTIERHEAVSLDMHDLPHEMRRRLALRAIVYLRREAGLDEAWKGTGLERLVAALETGQAGTLAGIAVRPGRRWLFRIAPPRQSH
ncbi:tRNA lysidine(34) synthetase TilS [Stakelama pacifica]|uniref:tRNA lysidine(34) synthetase TilS n=1 Tax=Stakelama pacifica TaxID=517720 RepID=UPI00105D8F71|nr:tRNA lysidine(34) synthetase TilS [Stakelama pacifica]